MIIKFLEFTTGMYFAFILFSTLWVLAKIFEKAVNLIKSAIFNSQRVLNFMNAVGNFDKHAELFYSALDLIGDEEQKQKLKTAWEDLLCLK